MTQSYMAEYYAQNRADLSKKAKARTVDLNRQVMAVLGSSCTECGEPNLEFLTVDHIFGDRKLERSYSSHTWKRDLINGILDVSKYQTLCRNCNEAKQRLNPVNLFKIRTPTGEFKTCSACDLEKDTSEFSTSSYRNKSGRVRTIDATCWLCTRFALLVITVKCYQLLGGECVCCSIDEPCKLNIDHVNNDGAIRRQDGEPTGVNLCRHILNGKRDIADYQLLCANCNYSKLRRGVCVHKVTA